MFDKNESIKINTIDNSNVKHIGHSYDKIDWNKILITLAIIGAIAICIFYVTGVINKETAQELIKIISGTTKAVL